MASTLCPQCKTTVMRGFWEILDKCPSCGADWVLDPDAKPRMANKVAFLAVLFALCCVIPVVGFVLGIVALGLGFLALRMGRRLPGIMAMVLGVVIGLAGQPYLTYWGYGYLRDKACIGDLTTLSNSIYAYRSLTHHYPPSLQAMANAHLPTPTSCPVGGGAYFYMSPEESQAPLCASNPASAPAATTQSRPSIDGPEATTTAATQSAAKPAAEMVTRVYDMRDLIISIPNFSGPRIDISSASRPSAKPFEPAPEPMLTKAEIVWQLIDTIQAKIDPPSWEINGGSGKITEMSGQTIVTQTEDNQRVIAAWLEAARRERGWQVQVKAWFLPSLSPEQDRQFRQRMDKELKVKFDDKPHRTLAFLNDANVEALLSKQDTSAKATVSTPRLTLFNGQRAYVSISAEHDTAASGPEQGAAGPRLFDGTILDVRTTVTDDARHTTGSFGKYVTVTVWPTVSRLIAKGANPEYLVAQSSLTADIPNKATMLLRLPMVRVRASGLQTKGDGLDATQSEEAIAKLVDKSAKPEEFAYVLIKPTVMLAGEDADAASQPASQPAAWPGDAKTLMVAEVLAEAHRGGRMCITSDLVVREIPEGQLEAMLKLPVNARFAAEFDKAHRAATQPATKPASQPASQPSTGPATQPSTAPASQRSTQPTSQQSSGPVATHASARSTIDRPALAL